MNQQIDLDRAKTDIVYFARKIMNVELVAPQVKFIEAWERGEYVRYPRICGRRISLAVYDRRLKTFGGEHAQG